MAMKRAVALAVVAGMIGTAGVASASEATCRRKVAGKAASNYLFAAKQFRACSANEAKGKTCAIGTRDAKVAGSLAAMQAKTLSVCSSFDAGQLGFASAEPLAVALAGTTTGEGRQVVDVVYGRTPGPLGTTVQKCAKVLTIKAAVAGKKAIKDLIKCGDNCTAANLQKVDGYFDKAEATINRKCAPADIAALLGATSLADYLADVRVGVQRVADAIHPLPGPVAVVTDPTATLITPPGVPFNLDVAGTVANVPHVGYVNSVEIEGIDAPYDPVDDDFTRNVLIGNPGGANISLFVKARTTLGTVSTTANLTLDLSTVSPDVVIQSPASGTITPSGSIVVSGTIVGDLSAADLLLVDGLATAFNGTTGDWSRSVTLGAGSVHLIEAEVQSISFGTSNEDSIIVLEGNAVPLGTRVPDANFNRLNDSGFAAVSGILQSELDDALAPSNFLGDSVSGGTITAFSTGSKSVSAGGVGPNTVEAVMTINNFHIEVDGVDGPLGIQCDATYNANQVIVDVQGNLFGQLQISVSQTDVTFIGSSSSLSGSLGLCDFAGAVLVDVEDLFETELTTQFGNEIPAAIDAALGGIDISGPLGGALDVTIDALYTDIPEDSEGVTFILDSNMTANSVVPGAPTITHTLVPTGVGTPVLDANVPGTGTPYDLGFCLSDGFVNRAMAAFMLQGLFNQSLVQVPNPSNPSMNIPLTTLIISLVTGDNTYVTQCPGCGVTLVLKPTSAAVSRAPQGGEVGTVTLIVPNYRVDMVADDGGTPLNLISANVTFELPITLNAQGTTITPTTGTLNVTNIQVVDNPFGANEAGFVTAAGQLFPLAADSLGGLFSAITLPSFQGLTVTGAGSGYNVSCSGIYMNLQ